MSRKTLPTKVGLDSCFTSTSPLSPCPVTNSVSSPKPALSLEKTSPEPTSQSGVDFIETSDFRDELGKTVRQRNALNKGIAAVTTAENAVDLVKEVGGVAVGGGIGLLAMNTGVETTLHEYLGHGYLGGHLTYDYSNTLDPAFQVDGWDNFNAMVAADGGQATWEGFKNWISGHDFSGDGGAGIAFVTHGEPNELGTVMGPAGQDGWVAVAGSLPTLVVTSLAVMGGMRLHNTSPAAAYGLMTFGALMHLNSCTYPVSAAMMPADLLEHGAEFGHDFARFAANMSEITGLAPKTIAVATAGLWIGIVPVVALGMYMHQKSSQNEMVPDHIALYHWLSGANADTSIQATFNELMDKYPKRAELVALSQKTLVHQYKLANDIGDPEVVKEELLKTQEEVTRAQDRFNRYLIKKLPTGTLDKARQDVIVKWEKLQSNGKLHKAMLALSVTGVTVGGLSQLFGLLGQTIAKGLAPVATALTYVFPALQVGVVGFNTYETYLDWKSDDEKVPRSAKIISAVRTGINYASAILLTLGICVPGLQVLILPAVGVGLINSLGLGLAKARIVKRSFDIHQSLGSFEWNYMVGHYENYLESFENGKSTWDRNDRRAVTRWVDLQLEAQNRGLLNVGQIERLRTLGIPLAPRVIEPVRVETPDLKTEPHKQQVSMVVA